MAERIISAKGILQQIPEDQQKLYDGFGEKRRVISEPQMEAAIKAYLPKIELDPNTGETYQPLSALEDTSEVLHNY